MEPRLRSRLLVIVLDENGVAVSSAHVTLQPPSPALALRCETGISGFCEFLRVPEESLQLRVEKEGYYSATFPSIPRPRPKSK